MANFNELLTTHEVASMLGLKAGHRHVIKLIETGQLNYVKAIYDKISRYMMTLEQVDNYKLHKERKLKLARVRKKRRNKNQEVNK